MTPQDEPPGQTPNVGWRWLGFTVLALLVAAMVAVSFLPDQEGGYGRREGLGAGAALEWERLDIVWEEGEPGGGAPGPAPAGEQALSDAPPAIVPGPEGGGPPSEPLPSPDADPGATIPAGSGSGRGEGPGGPGGGAGSGGPGGGGRGGGGRESPTILYSPWPSREFLATLKASGSLRYRLRVEIDGRVSTWELLGGADYECPPCRGEAERIIRALQFAPGTLNGRPVPCWVPYTIDFKKGGR